MSIVFNACENKLKQQIYPTIAPTVGNNTVNPFDNFNADVATVSKNIDNAKNNQPINDLLVIG